MAEKVCVRGGPLTPALSPDGGRGSPSRRSPPMGKRECVTALQARSVLAAAQPGQAGRVPYFGHSSFLRARRLASRRRPAVD